MTPAIIVTPSGRATTPLERAVMAQVLQALTSIDPAIIDARQRARISLPAPTYTQEVRR